MRAGASAVLATGRASIVDLVTLTVPRSIPGEPDPPGTATILGNTYPTVVMPDGKEWMAANLSYSGLGELSGGGAAFGRLYSWSDCDTLRTLLSDGWRIPEYQPETLTTEWQDLFVAAGIGGQEGKLRNPSLTYWAANPNGVNLYGFDLRGAGIEGGSLVTIVGRYWYLNNPGNPVGEYLSTNWVYNRINTGGGYVALNYSKCSLRLVRDYTPPVPLSPAVIRWTSHDRPLRFQGAVFQGLPGAVWNRGSRSDQAGSEVSTLACSVAGDLLVPWRTHPTDAAQVDQIDLSELAVLGLLEGATLQIDEAVLDSFPGAPAGESAADLPIGQVTTAVVLGEVVEASLDALSVAMRVRSFQHRAGASVPRAVFAPTCRWDFAGPECGYASQWAERTALETTEESIRLSALQAEDFGSVVPLSGRNMGIRRTLGVGDNDGLERTYALPEPWPWPMADNTQVAVGFECSKGFSALTGRPSCTMLLRQAQFGGFAGMPPPEGA